MNTCHSIQSPPVAGPRRTAGYERRCSLAATTLCTLRTRGRGVIRCLSGECWLTQSHDQHDYLLSAGEEFPVDGAGTVVVQALGDASVSVSASLLPRNSRSAALAPLWRARAWVRGRLEEFRAGKQNNRGTR